MLAVSAVVMVGGESWGWAQQQAPQAGVGGGGGGSGLVAGSSALAPQGSDPISQVAPARAAASAARFRYDHSRIAIDDFLRKERMLFEVSPEYVSAAKAQAEAYKAFDDARSECLASLELDLEYVEGRKIREALGRQIEMERARRYPDEGRLEGLIAHRHAISRQVSAREAEALGRDAGVVEARKNLTDATARFDALKRDFDLRLRTSDALASVRQAHRDAQVSFVASAAFAGATTEAANVMLKYAYYVQWLSTQRPYVINTPITYSPYPYATGLAPTGGVAVPAVPSTGIGYGLMPGQ